MVDVLLDLKDVQMNFLIKSFLCLNWNVMALFSKLVNLYPLM